MVLSAATLVQRCSGVIEAEIDNEVVALNIESGNCYGLNKTGSRIWQLIANPTRIADICSTLTAEFEIEPESCERDVIGLLEELRSENLVTLTETP